MSDAAAIRLDQFLKQQGLVDSGGQAKRLIQSGEVQVNGETETRRRRKLVNGAIVRLNGNDYVVEKADGHDDDQGCEETAP